LSGPLGRGAPCSWKKKIRHIASTITKTMGKEIVPGSCWIMRGLDSTINQRVDGQHSRLVTFKTSRFFAFVQDPSDENWNRLSGHLQVPPSHDPTSSPFLHFCHNGHASRSSPGGLGLGCVNGIEHGRFGTVLENNRQKECAAGTRPCPGHGSDERRCIAVHRQSGAPKPCLQGVPSLDCDHDPSCY
jgi:hypothetical protein